MLNNYTKAKSHKQREWNAQSLVLGYACSANDSAALDNLAWKHVNTQSDRPKLVRICLQARWNLFVYTICWAGPRLESGDYSRALFSWTGRHIKKNTIAIKAGHMNFKLWVDWLMVCFGRVIKFDNCAGLYKKRWHSTSPGRAVLGLPSPSPRVCTDVRWRQNQNFSDQRVTKFAYPWCSASSASSYFCQSDGASNARLDPLQDAKCKRLWSSGKKTGYM